MSNSEVRQDTAKTLISSISSYSNWALIGVEVFSLWTYLLDALCYTGIMSCCGAKQKQQGATLDTSAINISSVGCTVAGKLFGRSSRLLQRERRLQAAWKRFAHEGIAICICIAAAIQHSFSSRISPFLESGALGGSTWCLDKLKMLAEALIGMLYNGLASKNLLPNVGKIAVKNSSLCTILTQCSSSSSLTSEKREMRTWNLRQIFKIKGWLVSKPVNDYFGTN